MGISEKDAKKIKRAVKKSEKTRAKKLKISLTESVKSAKGRLLENVRR